MSSLFNIKGNGFSWNYGFSFFDALSRFRNSSGYVFISSTRFLLRPYDVTAPSNLLSVHSFMQFQLNCVCDVIFHCQWSEFLFIRVIKF